MSLIRNTALGEIEIHSITFSKLLMNITSQMGGKVILSSKEGKPLGGIDRKISATEAAKNMKFRYDKKENSIHWEFFVITVFGESIKEISNSIFDYLIDYLASMFPGVKGTITMNITGVKSKQIAPRNLSVTREF